MCARDTQRVLTLSQHPIVTRDLKSNASHTIKVLRSSSLWHVEFSIIYRRVGFHFTEGSCRDGIAGFGSRSSSRECKLYPVDFPIVFKIHLFRDQAHHRSCPRSATYQQTRFYIKEQAQSSIIGTRAIDYINIAIVDLVSADSGRARILFLQLYEDEQTVSGFEVGQFSAGDLADAAGSLLPTDLTVEASFESPCGVVTIK